MAIEKEDYYGQPMLLCHVLLLYSEVISMFVTLPNTSVQVEVIGERVIPGGVDGLELPVSYHFYDHEKGENWLKNTVEAIDKNLEKDIKHCLK